MKIMFFILPLLLIALVADVSAQERLENCANKTVLVFTPHPAGGYGTGYDTILSVSGTNGCSIFRRVAFTEGTAT